MVKFPYQGGPEFPAKKFHSNNSSGAPSTTTTTIDKTIRLGVSPEHFLDGQRKVFIHQSFIISVNQCLPSEHVN